MSSWRNTQHLQDSYSTKPRVDQASLNYTPSQASTSYAGSMAGTGQESYLDDDDAKSRVSTYSYRSDRDNTQFIRQVEGRSINALTDQYFLPTDDPEWNRLDKQHVAVVLGLNGLYPAKDIVRAVLAPQTGEPKRILDLGCGTGVWCIEMAKEFPNATVVGVDLAPCPIEPENLPSNCRFEVDNINFGLPHFTQQFDVVHLRFVAGGLTNFRQRMQDVHSCLKEGGIVLWVEVEYDLYFTDKFIYKPPMTEATPNGSWMQRPLAELRRAFVMNGSDVHGMEATLDEGLWDEQLLDPETCRTASLYLPIGPWATHPDPSMVQRLKYIGALMRQDSLNGMRSVQPLLRKVGWPAETVENWARQAEEENMSMNHQASMRVRLAWGRRRSEPGASAPPLPSLSTATQSNGEEDSFTPYPFYYLYDTKTAAVEQAALRNGNKTGDLPPIPSAIVS